MALSAVSGCSSGDGDSSSCSTICNNIGAAHCPGAANDCVSECEQQSADTEPACKDELAALRSCFGKATFSCDSDGVPSAAGCKTELSAWSSCNAGGGGGTPVDLCKAAADDHPCDTCFKQKCCAELSACVNDTDCADLLHCVTRCGGQLCLDSCFQQYPDAVDKLDAVSDCNDANCASVTCE